MLPLTETSDHSILSFLFPHFVVEILDFGTCKSALKPKVYWVLLPSENISVLLLWSTVSSTDILKKAFEKASSKSNGPKIKLESSISMATCLPCALYRTTLQTLTELRMDILGGELCRPLGHEDCCCRTGPLCRLNQRMFTMNRVQFSSVQDGIYVLGKKHMHSSLSLRSFPNIAFETVPAFIWLTMALSCSFEEDRLIVCYVNHEPAEVEFFSLACWASEQENPLFWPIKIFYKRMFILHWVSFLQ